MVSFRHRFSRSEKVVQIKNSQDLRGREATKLATWDETVESFCILTCKTLRFWWIIVSFMKHLIHWTQINVICQAFRVRFLNLELFFEIIASSTITSRRKFESSNFSHQAIARTIFHLFVGQRFRFINQIVFHYGKIFWDFRKFSFFIFWVN